VSSGPAASIGQVVLVSETPTHAFLMTAARERDVVDFVASSSLRIQQNSIRATKLAASPWNRRNWKQAVWAECRKLPWAQGVGRSNRPAPTNEIKQMRPPFGGREIDCSQNCRCRIPQGSSTQWFEESLRNTSEWSQGYARLRM